MCLVQNEFCTKCRFWLLYTLVKMSLKSQKINSGKKIWDFHYFSKFVSKCTYYRTHFWATYRFWLLHTIGETNQNLIKTNHKKIIVEGAKPTVNTALISGIL